MDLFFRYLLSGIGSGAAYAMVALALVLIFRSTGLLNLAQGEMALFSTYMAWKLTSVGASIVVAIVITVVLSMIGGAIIERLLIRPVSTPQRSHLDVLIVMLGLFLALNALAQLFFSADAEPMPKPWPTVSSPGDPVGFTKSFAKVGDVNIPWSTVMTVLVLAFLCALLWLLFQKTKLGLMMRAAASNQQSARLVGITSSTMLMLGWAMSAGLGAVAGVFAAAQRGSVNPGLMAVVLVYAFSAAALGGFDSAIGAVVGGMVVAIAESLTTGYVEALSTIELVVPFAIILIVLLVRPQGLFGRKTVERV